MKFELIAGESSIISECQQAKMTTAELKQHSQDQKDQILGKRSRKATAGQLSTQSVGSPTLTSVGKKRKVSYKELSSDSSIEEISDDQCSTNPVDKHGAKGPRKDKR